MKGANVGKLVNSIIGKYYENGYVEALICIDNRPSLCVYVYVTSEIELPGALKRAQLIFPSLLDDMGKAEALATTAAKSSVAATAFGIYIKQNGEASYVCGFFAGDAEDSLVSVDRALNGELEVA